MSTEQRVEKNFTFFSPEHICFVTKTKFFFFGWKILKFKFACSIRKKKYRIRFFLSIILTNILTERETEWQTEHYFKKWWPSSFKIIVNVVWRKHHHHDNDDDDDGDVFVFITTILSVFITIILWFCVTTEWKKKRDQENFHYDNFLRYIEYCCCCCCCWKTDFK